MTDQLTDRLTDRLNQILAPMEHGGLGAMIKLTQTDIKQQLT